MKCSIRIKLVAAFVLLVLVTMGLMVLEDKCETYDPLSYVQSSIPWLERENLNFRPGGSVPGDKIVVIPAMEKDDTSWVAEELPDWQRAIYLVNPSNKSLHSPGVLTTPVNKGHEAMAYLTYIIDNYNATIPSVVAFLHAHRNGFFEAWHVDTPLHDNVFALRALQLDFVKKSGYVNLRCNWNPGCMKLGRGNEHVTGQSWEELLGDTSTPEFNPERNQSGAMEATSSWADQEKSLYMNRYLSVWAPCCAQFAVTKEKIYERPLADYVKIRQWIIETEKNDRQSGRVMEYMWHVIFGMPAIHCPNQETCYCQVYGRC